MFGTGRVRSVARESRQAALGCSANFDSTIRMSAYHPLRTLPTTSAASTPSRSTIPPRAAGPRAPRFPRRGAASLGLSMPAAYSSSAERASPAASWASRPPLMPMILGPTGGRSCRTCRSPSMGSRVAQSSMAVYCCPEAGPPWAATPEPLSCSCTAQRFAANEGASDQLFAEVKLVHPVGAEASVTTRAFRRTWLEAQPIPDP